MKNTMYLILMQLFSLSQKGYFILYDEKIRICLKKGVLLCLKINDFGWKFFSPKFREKWGVFQTWVGARGIRFGRESVCMGVLARYLTSASSGSNYFKPVPSPSGMNYAQVSMLGLNPTSN